METGVPTKEPPSEATATARAMCTSAQRPVLEVGEGDSAVLGALVEAAVAARRPLTRPPPLHVRVGARPAGSCAPTATSRCPPTSSCKCTCRPTRMRCWPGRELTQSRRSGPSVDATARGTSPTSSSEPKWESVGHRLAASRPGRRGLRPGLCVGWAAREPAISWGPRHACSNQRQESTHTITSSTQDSAVARRKPEWPGLCHLEALSQAPRRAGERKCSFLPASWPRAQVGASPAHSHTHATIGR